MSEYTRRHQKFEYHLEDTECVDCQFYKSKKHGCDRDECCCGDIRAEAIANGRIERPRGWFRLDS